MLENVNCALNLLAQSLSLSEHTYFRQAVSGLGETTTTISRRVHSSFTLGTSKSTHREETNRQARSVKVPGVRENQRRRKGPGIAPAVDSVPSSEKRASDWNLDLADSPRTAARPRSRNRHASGTAAQPELSRIRNRYGHGHSEEFRPTRTTDELSRR